MVKQQNQKVQKSKDEPKKKQLKKQENTEKKQKIVKKADVKQDKQVKKQQKKEEPKQAKKQEKKDVKQQPQKVIEKSKKIKKNTQIKEIQEKQEEQKQIFNNYQNYIKEKQNQLQEQRQEIEQQIVLDQKQIKLAVKALVNYHQNKKNVANLLDSSNEDFIYIEISMKKLPEKYSIRPIEIKLKHPIYSKEYNSQFCLFVQDPQREFKDKIQDLDLDCIAKVQGYSKLIKKFPTFMDKRKLCQDFDLFFCDYRIYDLLNKHTGKNFYQRKKIPFPLEFQNDSQKLKKQLNGLQNNSYFIFGNGPVYTLKVARVGMQQQQIVDNIVEAFYQLIPHILCENITTSSVEQISIKTFNSVSLPFYNYLSGKEIKSYKA